MGAHLGAHSPQHLAHRRYRYPPRLPWVDLPTRLNEGGSLTLLQPLPARGDGRFAPAQSTTARESELSESLAFVRGGLA